MASPSPLLQPPSGRDERSTPWAPMVIGPVVVVALIAIIYWFTKPTAPAQTPVSPYAAQLQLSDLKMATADNFVGATVTYVEGKVTNRGGQTATHAVVEVIFKNSLDQIVQQERVPLMVLADRPGYSDALDLARLPLGPGESHAFRLTFEHVSSDWNRQYPGVRVLSVDTR